MQDGASNSLEIVLKKYMKWCLMKGRYSIVQGYEAKLVMYETAVPRFCKARPVPYMPLKKIEEELNKFVPEGYITTS